MTRRLKTRCDWCVAAVPGQFQRTVGRRVLNMCARHRDRSVALKPHQALLVSVAWRKLAAGQVVA